MNKLFIFSALMITLAGVSACKTTVQDGPAKITIQEDGAGGDFCPPGQAKKGNC